MVKVDIYMYVGTFDETPFKLFEVIEIEVKFTCKKL